MRMRPAYAAGAVALLLGVAGLVGGAFLAESPAAGAGQGAAAADGVTAGDITVSGAYVRQPASPDVVAAYLTITNNGTQPDTLEAVETGAARSAAVHDVPGLTSGSGAHQPTGPLTIAPGATLTLSPGRGHIMLESPTTTFKVGDRVSLVLTFTRAGQVLVEAPVIGISAPAPTGGSTP